MAKDKISDYSATNASNTDIGGVNIQGSSTISKLDDGLREVMTHLAEMNAGTYPLHDTLTFADPADTTKKFRLDGGSVTAGQTRVLAVPDADGTIALGAIGAEIQAYDALLTDIAALTMTEGAIIYGVGTDNVSVLAKGAAAQVLAMNSGATAPEWVTGPSMVKISSQTVSSPTAAVDFTSIPTGYSKFVLIAKNVVTDEAASSSTVLVRTSTDNGASFTTGASAYYLNATNQNFLISFVVPGNTSTFKYHHSEIAIFGMGDVNSATSAFSMGNSRGVSATSVTQAAPTTGGTRVAAELDNAIRCAVPSVNFTAGTFILYGVKE